MEQVVVSVLMDKSLREVLHQIATDERRSLSSQIVYILEKEPSVSVELIKRGE